MFCHSDICTVPTAPKKIASECFFWKAFMLVFLTKLRIFETPNSVLSVQRIRNITSVTVSIGHRDFPNQTFCCTVVCQGPNLDMF
jgi:hypothetical protein